MMLRAFIAIEIPAEIQLSIAQSTASFQKEFPKPIIRWVLPQNLHLTLKFLGNISPLNLEKIDELLKGELIHQKTFQLTLGGIGVFPSLQRPRVIWIGMDTPPGLITLQHCVERASVLQGFASEERPFSPHLTIGRTGNNVSAADLVKIHTSIQETTIGTIGTFQVDAVHIFQSELQPSGPIYKQLYRIPLNPQ